MMLYFAYGSNMCTPRLAARVPAVRARDPAVLPGHCFQLDLAGDDDSAKCNIVASDHPNDVVHGVCFEIDPAQLDVLHAAEGPAYEFIELTVYVAGEPVTAAVYRGLPHWRDARRRPWQWYLDYVLAGAREHGLPGDWIEFLAGHPADIDPDAARRTANRAALCRP